MPFELLLLLFGLLPAVLRGGMGWRSGATLEMRHTLTYLFALLAALRYWRAATEAVLGFLPVDPQFLAAGIFLALFVIAALLASLIVNLKGEFYQSVSPHVLDHALGAVCGVVSGALLGGVLMMLCAFLMPGKVDGFSVEKIPGRVDKLPFRVFQTVETRIAGIAPESPARTQFPTPTRYVVVEPLVSDPVSKPAR